LARAALVLAVRTRSQSSR